MAIKRNIMLTELSIMLSLSGQKSELSHCVNFWPGIANQQSWCGGCWRWLDLRTTQSGYERRRIGVNA